MDTGLWKKIQRMAASGERVVVVEDGQAFVLVPFAEYERMQSGEASLQRLPIAESEAAPIFRPAGLPRFEGAGSPPGEGLWQASRQEREKETFSVDDRELGLASDEADEEERFYLEPVE